MTLTCRAQRNIPSNIVSIAAGRALLTVPLLALVAFFLLLLLSFLRHPQRDARENPIHRKEQIEKVQDKQKDEKGSRKSPKPRRIKRNG